MMPVAVAATKPAAIEKKSGAKIAEMSSEEAADLYRDMMLGRDFEDMCAQMYYRGKMFGEWMGGSTLVLCKIKCIFQVYMHVMYVAAICHRNRILHIVC